jgi:hypothetical protein
MVRRLLPPLFAAALAPLALASTALAQAPAPAAPVPCTPDGAIGFICGLSNVEDMVAVPGGRWILGSAMQAGAGAVYLIDARKHTAKPAAIAFAAAETPFAGCKAPDMSAIRTHGLELRPGADGVHTLYAVNHGGRESVEVFRVDTLPGEPRLTWIGCLAMPAGASGNALVALPGGALALTKFMDAADTQGIVHILNGDITGTVYLWKPATGFKELAGAQLSGDNGMVASRDFKWLYVTDYGRKQVYRVPLDGSGKTSSVAVDFHPDNLRWAPDGKINVTGQYIELSNRNGLHGWSTVKLDPAAMTVSPYVKVAGTPAFDNGTTALQVGKELWIGTYRGDRVAYLPAP